MRSLIRAVVSVFGCLIVRPIDPTLAQVTPMAACGDSAISSAFPPRTQLIVTQVPQYSPFYTEFVSFHDSVWAYCDRADTLYDRKQYDRAVLELLQIDTVYFQNPYMKNKLARTTYWSKSRRLAIPLYESLIRQLDEDGNEDAGPLDSTTFVSRVVLNITFGEAYWKLGTLYMDENRWMEARSLLHIFETHLTTTAYGDSAGWEQLYMFLAETYFFLNDPAHNRYYYCLTKSINPKNEYVEKFKL